MGGVQIGSWVSREVVVGRSVWVPVLSESDGLLVELDRVIQVLLAQIAMAFIGLPVEGVIFSQRLLVGMPRQVWPLRIAFL